MALVGYRFPRTELCSTGRSQGKASVCSATRTYGVDLVGPRHRIAGVAGYVSHRAGGLLRALGYCFRRDHSGEPTQERNRLAPARRRARVDLAARWCRAAACQYIQSRPFSISVEARVRLIRSNQRINRAVYSPACRSSADQRVPQPSTASFGSTAHHLRQTALQLSINAHFTPSRCLPYHLEYALLVLRDQS